MLADEARGRPHRHLLQIQSLHQRLKSRVWGPAIDPAHPGTPLHWANSANIAFHGHGNIVSTNHASLTGLPDPSRVFAVFVDDKAGKLFGEDDNGL